MIRSARSQPEDLDAREIARRRHTSPVAQTCLSARIVLIQFVLVFFTARSVAHSSRLTKKILADVTELVNYFIPEHLIVQGNSSLRFRISSENIFPSHHHLRVRLLFCSVPKFTAHSQPKSSPLCKLPKLAAALCAEFGTSSQSQPVYWSLP